MRDLTFVFLILFVAISSSCSKDGAFVDTSNDLSLTAGQVSGITYFSNLTYPLISDLDSQGINYSLVALDINQDNILDVSFELNNNPEESSIEFKSLNNQFNFYSDSLSNGRVIIKPYLKGESIEQFHELTSPNLFVSIKNDDVDFAEWNNTENQYMAFSYVADSGYVNGLGWLEVSITDYYNLTVHNWGIIENDLRN